MQRRFHSKLFLLLNILDIFIFIFFLLATFFPFHFVSIRFAESLLHATNGTHLISDEVAQPLLDLSRHGITITPITTNSSSATVNDNSSLASSLSILKQSRMHPLSFFDRDQQYSRKKNVTVAELSSAALDLSNRGGG